MSDGTVGCKSFDILTPVIESVSLIGPRVEAI